MYYRGYWINKNWFEKYHPIFLQEFHFPEITDERNLCYQEQILTSNSVSVHVRRGDYVSLKWDLETDVYEKALETFAQQVPGEWRLFVFSDDISWCQEHARELGFVYFQKVTYIEGNMRGRNFRHMQLMSMCKGMIVSNSAFCYLAALLNTRKEYGVNLSGRDL